MSAPRVGVFVKGGGDLCGGALVPCCAVSGVVPNSLCFLCLRGETAVTFGQFGQSLRQRLQLAARLGDLVSVAPTVAEAVMITEGAGGTAETVLDPSDLVGCLALPLAGGEERHGCLVEGVFEALSASLVGCGASGQLAEPLLAERASCRRVRGCRNGRGGILVSWLLVGAARRGARWAVRRPASELSFAWLGGVGSQSWRSVVAGWSIQVWATLSAMTSAGVRSSLRTTKASLLSRPRVRGT